MEVIDYCFHVAGHADVIRVLINAGADLQKADNFGSTPLHLACIYGHLHCVKLLCELVIFLINLCLFLLFYFLIDNHFCREN